MNTRNIITPARLIKATTFAALLAISASAAATIQAGQVAVNKNEQGRTQVTVNLDVVNDMISGNLSADWSKGIVIDNDLRIEDVVNYHNIIKANSMEDQGGNVVLVVKEVKDQLIANNSK